MRGVTVFERWRGDVCHLGMRSESGSVLAAILSVVIPGLGQLYKGYFLWAVFWFVTVTGLYALFGWFVLILIPLLMHIICIVQAYVLPRKTE